MNAKDLGLATLCGHFSTGQGFISILMPSVFQPHARQAFIFTKTLTKKSSLIIPALVLVASKDRIFSKKDGWRNIQQAKRREVVGEEDNGCLE